MRLISVEESNHLSVKANNICFFSFFDFGLSDVLQNNIKKSKYDKPTPIQKWAIPVISNGRDVMACAVTGSGKTVSTLHLSFTFNDLFKLFDLI